MRLGTLDAISVLLLISGTLGLGFLACKIGAGEAGIEHSEVLAALTSADENGAHCRLSLCPHPMHSLL